jgi:threonine dehydratase
MTVRLVRRPTAVEVEAAAVVVAHHLAPTPVLASPRLGADVVLKLETVQPTGSFKVRGALVAVAASLERAAVTGGSGRPVVTASAGNHGLGVAWAAQIFGVRAVIVIPENASEAKRTALGVFEAEIVRHGRSFEEAESRALELTTRLGGDYLSAYNDPDVIAGQGTIALELIDQLPELTTIVAPVGGGGLLAGLALGVKLGPAVAVRGVGADASPAMVASVAAGAVVDIPIAVTLADGLAGNIEAGSVTVPLVATGVEGLTGVGEEAIASAVRFLAFEHGLVCEPSGAVAVAGLLAGRTQPGRGTTAVVVTGRNITAALLGQLLSGTTPG